MEFFNEINDNIKEIKEVKITSKTIVKRNKISVYIINFNDFGFLKSVINNIYSLVDEIILVDGPYNFNIDVFKKLNLYYDETNKPIELVKLLIKYSNKIKYFYKIFNNQEEKRIFGYSECSNDLILLLDSDDFCILNENTITQFIKSNKCVASADIYNMNRVNVIIDKKIEKNILFKKKFISPEEHIVYTWCNNTNIKPNPIYIYNDKIGVIYHQTLNRNKSDSITKFIYYICLYYFKRNYNKVVEIDNLPLVGDFTLTNLLSYLTIDEVLNIFYHSKMELISFPEKDKILYHIPDLQDTLGNFFNNQVDAIFSENSLAIRYIPYYCIVPIDKNYINQIEMIFDNVTQIQVTIYEINLDEPYKIFNQTYTFSTENLVINYLFEKKQNYFTTVIQFNCFYTIDNTNKYLIQKINYINNNNTNNLTNNNLK